MKTLLSYLGNLKEYLIFSALILISLILIFQNDNVQIRFVRVIAVNVIGVVQNGFSFIPNIFELERENKTLREANIDSFQRPKQFKRIKARKSAYQQYA